MRCWNRWSDLWQGQVAGCRRLTSGCRCQQCNTATTLSPGREDVEDLCNAAVKEEAIETKLKAVAEQWAQEIFTFADHKSRGPVVLKVGGWGEGVGMGVLSALLWVTRQSCCVEHGAAHLLPTC